MDKNDKLAERFEAERIRLKAVAYRMLGSVSEADDAVQETWLRLSRSDISGIENLGGWLTTVISRICLDLLRSRKSRREEPGEVYLPDPIVTRDDGTDPEREAMIADSVGLALLVVLETLSPAERLAYVLHDMFGVPFEEIAPIADRSPAATRKLASRARGRVEAEAAVPDVNLSLQRKVVDAFFAASRSGDFDALVAVLDPDVVLRSAGGTAQPGATITVRTAEAVADRARAFSDLEPYTRRAIINGVPGIVVETEDGVFSILAFTVRNGLIVQIDVLADQERLAALELPDLG